MFAGYFDIPVTLKFFCFQQSVTDLMRISQQAVQVLVWNNNHTDIPSPPKKEFSAKKLEIYPWG